MCGSREGVARSCVCICSCSRRADRRCRLCVCVCVVCAGMRDAAASRRGTRSRAVEQATSQRYLMRVHMKNITLIFSSSQEAHIQPQKRDGRPGVTARRTAAAPRRATREAS
jgi:hypothetical protein